MSFLKLPTQQEMMQHDYFKKDKAERMGNIGPLLKDSILTPRYDRSGKLGSKPNKYNQFDDDGYKPFIPEPEPLINTFNRFDDDDGYKPFIPEPLIDTYNKFDDNDDDGYKPFIPEPTPLINTFNRFNDDGYNPLIKKD